MRKIKIATVIVASIVVLAGFNQQVSAQVKGGITKRVELSKSTPCVILTGAVQPKNFDTYIFRAVNGQTIIAEPFWLGRETNRPKGDEEGSSDFIFIPPVGNASVDPQDVIFPATRTGAYTVKVRPTYRRTNGKYVLKIQLLERPKDEDVNADFTKPPTCP